MFGYIQPDMPYLYGKDATLYKAMYCGLCKSIGASCGQRARLALSFDMTFLSALLHNIMNTDVHIRKAHCVLHPIVKRPVAGDDAITRAVACLNTAFTYYKLSDDVADEHKGKIKRAFFAKGFRKSETEHPEIARIIQRRMEELWKLEKENADSLDRAADPFGMMIADLSDYVLKGVRHRIYAAVVLFHRQMGVPHRRARRLRKGYQKEKLQSVFRGVRRGEQVRNARLPRRRGEFRVSKRICGKRGVFAEYQIPFQPRSDGQYHLARHSRDDQTHPGGQMRLQNKKRIEESARIETRSFSIR